MSSKELVGGGGEVSDAVRVRKERERANTLKVSVYDSRTRKKYE